MRAFTGTWALCAVLLCTGCIVPAPSGESSPSAAPPLVLPGGANFGGKVELVRVAYRPGRFSPGEPINASLTFRVLQTFSEDYLIFVHVEDGGGRVERRNLDHVPMGGTRPTRTWRPGELLVDEFNLEVPPGATRMINVWMGFWEASRDVRLPVTNPDRVRTDGHDRVLIGQIPLTPL
jgi:hypothetical protein